MINGNTGQYIYNLKDFDKYISFTYNKNMNISHKNLIIEDKEGEYLQELDNIKQKVNFSKVKYLEYKNKNKKPLFITFTNNILPQEKQTTFCKV